MLSKGENRAFHGCVHARVRACAFNARANPRAHTHTRTHTYTYIHALSEKECLLRKEGKEETRDARKQICSELDVAHKCLCFTSVLPEDDGGC